MREIWAALYRSRFWVIGIFIGCMLLAIAASLLTTRLYTATAMIEVRQEAEKVLGTEQDREGGASRLDSDRFLQTQLDIIRSRTIADTVAQSAGLYRGTTFLDAMHITPENDDDQSAAGRDTSREQVLQVLRKNMTVKYSGTTRIAIVSFTSPDPRLSAKIANAYVEAFIRGNLARKAGSSVYALDFLRGQLREAQERLARSEQAVVDYARRTRIVDAGDAAGSSASGENGRPQSLITAQLVQLNQAYSTAIADRIQAQQKWTQVARLPVINISEVLANSAIQTLLERRAQLEAQYKQQLSTRQADYPGVSEARAQIQETTRQINALAGNIRAGIKNQYDVASARERELSSEIDKLKSETLSEQNQGIELSILRREADTNRQQYEALLRRFNALNAESGVQTNNLSVIDQASIPNRPSWPILPLNIAISLILAMALSGFFVFLREQLFYRLRTPDEVIQALDLQLLGVIPSADSAKDDLGDVKSAQSEAYASVRTSLSLLSRDGTPRSIVVTSTQQGEGKSTASYAMALAFARLGKRVLLIDVDLRRPNVHRFFGLSNTSGLSNYLSSQVSAEKLVHSTNQPQLDIIVAGDIPPNPAELLNSTRIVDLLNDLLTRYDVVLLDSAPVLGLADAVVLSNVVEATVFVIESAKNSPQIVQNALKRLRQGGGTIVGAILVKFDPGRSGYGTTADYGYSYEYSARDD